MGVKVTIGAADRPRKPYPKLIQNIQYGSVYLAKNNLTITLVKQVKQVSGAFDPVGTQYTGSHLALDSGMYKDFEGPITLEND